jgi:hydroxylamine reductase (hybrid-cluster protein)
MLGGELTIEETGRGVEGDDGIVIGFGGEAANGVYNSTAALDSLSDDLKHASIKRLFTVVGCSLKAKNKDILRNM